MSVFHTFSLLRRLLPALLVGGSLTLSGTAHADGTLAEATKGLADEIASYCKGRAQVSDIIVNATRGPRSATNVLVQKQLQEHLKAQGLTVKTTVAPLEVDSKILFSKPDGEDEQVVRLVVQLINSNTGAEELGFRRAFYNAGASEDVPLVEKTVAATEDIAQLVPSSFDSTVEPAAAGTTVAKVAPQKVTPDAQRQAIIQQSLVKSTTHLADGYIKAQSNSPYRMRVIKRVGPKYQAIPDRHSVEGSGDNSFVFVDLQAGEEYAVQVENLSEFDIAIKFTVDGLSVFEFCEIPEFKKNDVFLLPAKKALVIPGWYINQSTAKAFEVAALPESAAPELGRDDGRVGTLQCRVFGAWVGKEPPPIYAQAGGTKDVGTKVGRAVSAEFSQLQRTLGSDVVASITAFYVKPPTDLPNE